jgi:hypothetical protein
MRSGKWTTAAALVGSGALVMGGLFASSASASATPVASVQPASPVLSVQDATVAAKKKDPLSGKRQVTIIRKGTFESGVALLKKKGLVERDDDAGRQLFVPTPLGKGKYLIKAYQRGSKAKATCWQSYQPKPTASLRVRSAKCNPKAKTQRFEIVKVKGKGKGYVFSNRDAYLWHTDKGFILEEIGDATLDTYFKLVDNGKAPA